MTSVVVLGASGMLGSTVLEVLSTTPGLQVAGTVRSASQADACRERVPEVTWRLLDAAGDEHGIRAAIDGADWVVNAIGLTKPFIHDDNPVEVERALRINGLFPFALARAAEASNSQVVQIATDCVYSGSAGRYAENAPHDALDVYGKTKSLGEVALPPIHLLRCSIIGPQPSGPAYLLEWLRGQPDGAIVNGYSDHLWNGVTTLAFGHLCRGLITGAAPAPTLQHVIPAGDVSKADLLTLIATAYGRDDIKVRPGPAPEPVDRTLRTRDADSNAALWRGAGYGEPPSVSHMVAELAAVEPRLARLSQ
jgi:dTDP-4-dehydrorhamnose reductase